MDHAHKSNFTETIEHAPSNVPLYVRLAIRRRRNERRVRHGNIYNLNRIRRLSTQNTNNLFINRFFNGATFR
jgi:hypothetical protein